jgi:hypothetical protein
VLTAEIKYNIVYINNVLYVCLSICDQIEWGFGVVLTSHVDWVIRCPTYLSETLKVCSLVSKTCFKDFLMQAEIIGDSLTHIYILGQWWVEGHLKF